MEKRTEQDQSPTLIGCAGFLIGIVIAATAKLVFWFFGWSVP